MMFSFPIVISIIQVLLMIFVFRYDSPPFLKKRGENKNLNEFMSKLYKPEYVQAVIDELGGDEISEDGNTVVSYK